MSEQVHKGWLSSRDGLKFSPYVLAEGIKNRDGSSFLDNVANLGFDIEIIKNQLNRQGLSQLENAFYITDAAGYIIMRVDEEGIHSIDYNTYNKTGEFKTSLNTLYEDLQLELEQRSQSDMAINKKIQHIDVTNNENETIIDFEHPLNLPRITKGDSNTFYITDDRGYVIFKVDRDGIKTTNITLINNLPCITFQVDDYITDFEEITFEDNIEKVIL